MAYSGRLRFTMAHPMLWEAQSGAGKHEKRWLASAMRELPNCPHIWPSHSWVTYGQGRLLYSDGTAYVTYAVPSLYSKRPCSLRMGDLGWVCTQGCWATRWELQPGGHPAAESLAFRAVAFPNMQLPSSATNPKGHCLSQDGYGLWKMLVICWRFKILRFSPQVVWGSQTNHTNLYKSRKDVASPSSWARTSWRLILRLLLRARCIVSGAAQELTIRWC